MPLAWALISAVVLHWAGLTGLAASMGENESGQLQRADPLFTRTIETAAPASRPTPASRKLPKGSLAANRAARSLEAPLQEPQPEPAPPDSPETEKTAEVQRDPTPAQTLAESTPVEPELPAPPQGERLVAGDWPADTRVGYRLSGMFQGELHGSGQVQWTRDEQAPDRYQVRVRIDGGLYALTLTSQGRIGERGLLPAVYEEATKAVVGKTRVRTVSFEDQVLVLHDKRQVARPASDPTGVQDAVSQFIDLGHRLQTGQTQLREGGSITVWLGRPGGLDEWTYDVGAQETISLPRIGPVLVYRLSPRPLATPRGTIVMSMWLAPSLQYLPAKIRIDLNADAFVELHAEQIQQR